MRIEIDLNGNITEHEDAPIVEQPPKTQEQLDVEARQAKQLALDSITVTTSTGKVFDGRDKDQARMLSAIQASTSLGATTTMWKLNDNTTVEITLDELKEAQALSIQALGNILVGGA